MNLSVLDPRPTRSVNCLSIGCTLCCQADAVFIHPECGDDAALYQCEVAADGRFILAHQANGDCVYLDRQTGCTIHDRRPTVCREMSCIAILDQLGDKRMKAIGLGRIVLAAKRIRKTAINRWSGSPA